MWKPGFLKFSHISYGYNIKEVCTNFYSQQVVILLMKDATFVSKLYSKELIPGDLKHKIYTESNLIQREAATCFFDNAIKPTMNTRYNEPFSILLSEMEPFINHSYTVYVLSTFRHCCQMICTWQTL